MAAVTIICPLVLVISDNPAQTRWRERGHLWPRFFFLIYLFIFGCVGSSFLCEGFL